ncbi:putative tyrosine-protein phosphatase, partial [Pyrenochaeta sp. MPI-SDFR-AT-0127]
PFHIVPGVSNFRDIGGWPITSQCSPTPLHVRKGLIYRGSDTTRITATGIAKLQELNVKTDFDLRSKQQIIKAGGFKDMNDHGIERIWAPVFPDAEYTEEKTKERYKLYASENPSGIVTAFIEILVAGAPMMKIVLKHLLDTTRPHTPIWQCPTFAPQQPALFMHCTTGNNRTGVFISLLLLLLGVAPEDVVQEYTLSEQGLAPTRHINVERLLKKGAFEEYGADEARQKCERMIGARASSMVALLAEVEQKWGGPEGYFKDVVGLTGDEVERVQNVL